MSVFRVFALGILFFFTQTLFAENLVIEDFSSAPINPLLLNAVDSNINAGQYKVEISQNNNGKTTNRVFIDQRNVTFLGAKVTLSSESNTSGTPTPRVRGRLTHNLGNVDFNTNDPLIDGDGLKGNIWTQLVIERRSNGGFRISAYAEKATDALGGADTLFFQTLSSTVSYNQQYELAIEMIDSTVNYKINGATEFSFDLTDNTTYPALTGSIFPAMDIAGPPAFLVSIQDGPGTGVVLFDDITINSLQATPPTVSSVQNIPTSSQWGLLMFIGLLLTIFGFRKKMR